MYRIIVQNAIYKTQKAGLEIPCGALFGFTSRIRARAVLSWFKPHDFLKYYIKLAEAKGLEPAYLLERSMVIHI